MNRRTIWKRGLIIAVALTATSCVSQIVKSAKANDLEGVKQQLAEQADPNAMDDCLTPLHYAALYGNLAMAKVMIERGADVNAPAGKCFSMKYGDVHNFPPLFLSHSPEVTDLLVAHGADPHKPVTQYFSDGRPYEETAIEFAARYLSPEMVRKLLSLGVKPDGVYEGINSRRPEVVEILVNAGAECRKLDLETLEREKKDMRSEAYEKISKSLKRCKMKD